VVRVVEALNVGTSTWQTTAACHSRTADVKAMKTDSTVWTNARVTARRLFYKVQTECCVIN